MLVSPYRLREFTDRDFDAALALWKKTPGIGMTESDTPEMLAAFLQRNPGLSSIVETDSELVGTVLCGHDGRRGFLYHLAVAQAHRHHGIANALVEACLAHLNRLGLLKCNILVLANNASGRSYWQHVGWKARDDLLLMQTFTAGNERR